MSNTVNKTKEITVMNSKAEKQNTWTLKRYLPNELCRHIGGFLYGKNKNIIMFNVPIPSFHYMGLMKHNHMMAVLQADSWDNQYPDFYTMWKLKGNSDATMGKERPSLERRRCRDIIGRYPIKNKNQMIREMNRMIKDTYAGNCRLPSPRQIAARILQGIEVMDDERWCECEECDSSWDRVWKAFSWIHTQHIINNYDREKCTTSSAYDHSSGRIGWLRLPRK